MTQDKIISLARESCPYTKELLRGAYYEGFVKAANLIAAHVKSDQINLAYQQGYEEGSAHEREACAKVCDAVLGENNVSAAIRARGEK